VRETETETETDWKHWQALPFRKAVARWERHLISRALEQSGGNKSDAAKRLEIKRRLLYQKLQQFMEDE